MTVMVAYSRGYDKGRRDHLEGYSIQAVAVEAGRIARRQARAFFMAGYVDGWKSEERNGK